MATIYIGIGSNIQRDEHINAGCRSLAAAFSALRCSAVYESSAVGFDGDPFYNLVAEAQTAQSVAQVCQTLRAIEFRHGRPADARKFSSRTLDLDLLAYDALCLRDPLVLPREEVLTNAFVLRPFAELSPEYRHPVAGLTLAELWHRFDATQQPLRQVDFPWSQERAYV